MTDTIKLGKLRLPITEYAIQGNAIAEGRG